MTNYNQVIAEMVLKMLNESPLHPTVKRRLYKNQLTPGKYVGFPTQEEVDHEVKRFKDMWKEGKKSNYETRLTKVTNPKKMYAAYLVLSKWRTTHPEDKGVPRLIHFCRNYLTQGGYDYLLAGKGGKKSQLIDLPK